jgi:hypothetical protein
MRSTLSFIFTLLILSLAICPLSAQEVSSETHSTHSPYDHSRPILSPPPPHWEANPEDNCS